MAIVIIFLTYNVRDTCNLVMINNESDIQCIASISLNGKKI